MVVTKAHEDRKKRELDQYKKLENELISIGVEIIHKKGMHEKLVFVDDSAVWMGSLNALSFSGETGEIMHRHCDRAIAAEYKKIYHISYIQTATEKSAELLCPICGKEMQLCEGDRGVYWKCINNDYTRSINQQYPYDGVLHCHCGGSYHFAMKNQPRWVCNDNPKHFQKMRKNDLKLPKMAALIPAESLETIILYFSFDENDENRPDQSEISSNELNDREDEEKVFRATPHK